MLDDPALPFFTQWEIDPALPPERQSRGADRHRGGRDLRQREHDRGLARRTAGAADFHFDWIEDEDPGLVAVHFSTPHGTVRID